MSVSFLRPTASNNPKPSETNAGTVTKWVAIPTAFPSQSGCAQVIISPRSSNLTGWHPGYAISVDASVKCWPAGATTQWDQWDRRDPTVTISLGPIACPEAHYTVGSNAKGESSTLVACCPSGYTFGNDAPILVVAPVGQCFSLGQVFEYASDFGGSAGWLKTSITATATTSVLGVPFNGWQFKEATAAAAAITSSPIGASALLLSQTSTGATPSPISNGTRDGMHDAHTSGAKIGIGIGVGVGVLLVVGVLLWIFVDPLGRIRHRRLADRVEAASRAQGRGPSPPQPPTPPSLREFAIGSPTPPSMNPDQPLEMGPLSFEVLSLSLGGQRHPQDVMDLGVDAAPAPVVAGVGIRRSSSAVNYHSRSGSRPHYSAGEWAHGSSSSQSAQNPASPSRSLRGIGPTGRSGRNDSTSSQADPSAAVGRSGSQRGVRIVTSPVEMAGRRYDMVFEV